MERYTRIIDVTLRQIMKREQINFVKPKIIYAVDEASLPKRRIPEATPTPTPQPIFEDRSTSIRLNVEWPRAVRAFLKNPILGTGFSSITLATDSHYLRLLGEVGILGSLSFFLIFLRVAKPLLQSLSQVRGNLTLKTAFLAGVIGALPAIFLNAVFIDVFEASKFAIIFWLMLGFSIALTRQDEI